MNRAVSIAQKIAWTVEFEHPMQTDDVVDEITKWCKENCSGTFSPPAGWSKQVAFWEKDDAHLFYLTFR